MRRRDRKNNMNEANKRILGLIKEDEEKAVKKTTVTKHPAYPAVDRLERALEDLKMEFKDSIANAVSGSDGYHSEIDKFSEDFGKFITKVSKMKSKINDHQIANKIRRWLKLKNGKRNKENTNTT